ncbi:dTMP kinase [Phycisphaerales bacterium ac7]
MAAFVGRKIRGVRRSGWVRQVDAVPPDRRTRPCAGLAVCEVRDPGGTAISERIREVLLDPSLPEMGVRCELMMYMASRAQLVSEKVEPALERGELVLADRYVSSTLAYQGTAGGISKEEIISVARAACGRHWPADLTVVFDVDQATAATRLNPLLDRMEQKGEAFHKRVRAGISSRRVR